jgi:hypothetical protein
MAQRKYKVTGFARFVLFMLFFIPIAYFGLSMAKGEHPSSFVERVKAKIQGIKNFKPSLKQDDDDIYKQLISKEEEIQKLREELFQCQNSK